MSKKLETNDTKDDNHDIDNENDDGSDSNNTNINDDDTYKKNNMKKKKIILVAGGNKGIGLAIVELLLQNKFNHVILSCRSFKSIPQKDKTGKIKNDPAFSI